MIKGVHTKFYSSAEKDLREFLRDKIGFKGTDIGEGWLIFDVPEGEKGVHPAEGNETTGAPSGSNFILL